MAKKVAKSNLISKLGNAGRKAFEQYKDAPVEVSDLGNCPAGVEGGIAQLTDMKFDQYKSGAMKGEYYFYAAGTVVKPTELNGVPIEGTRVNIMEPLCDTPTRSRATVDEHVKWVLNEMKKLGLETSELGFEDLESAAETLVEAAPFFRFRSWKMPPATEGPYKGKESQTNYTWNGAVEFDIDQDGDEAAPAVEDNTSTQEEEPADAGDVDAASLAEAADNGDEEAAAAITALCEEAGIDPNEFATWAEAAEAYLQSSEPSEEEEEESESSEEGTDLESVAEAADNGDEDAAVQLTEAANGVGLDPNDYPTWAELATALQEGEEGSEETESIEVGGVYSYKPPKARKPVECEVLKVNEKTRTCTLQNLDDGTSVYINVPFDALA